MIYQNREYGIFSMGEINSINFEEVLETSSETVKKSTDETKSFVKWEGEIPTSVASLTTLEGPYTYEEMTEILKTSEWSSNTNFGI